MDLSTREGVLRFCELRRNEMVGCFDKLGSYVASSGLAYMGYVFARHAIITKGLTPDKWRTGPELPEIAAVPVNIPREAIDVVPWDQRTRLLGNAITGFNRLTKAEGYIIMSEAWFVRSEKENVLPRDYKYGWVEKRPERREALMVMLMHTKFGTNQWVAEIKRDPTRVEPWEEMGPPDVKEGRLVGGNNWRE